MEHSLSPNTEIPQPGAAQQMPEQQLKPTAAAAGRTCSKTPLKAACMGHLTRWTSAGSHPRADFWKELMNHSAMVGKRLFVQQQTLPAGLRVHSSSRVIHHLTNMERRAECSQKNFNTVTNARKWGLTP